MPRDALDAPIHVLCSEAENAAAGLAHVESAWPYWASIGQDPMVHEATLMSVSERGRAAHTKVLAAKMSWHGACAGGTLYAEQYHAAQRLMRRTLRSITQLCPGPVAVAASYHLSLWSLRAPRLRGAAEQARRVLEDLERADQPLVNGSVAPQLLTEARTWHATLETAFREREEADRALRAVAHLETHAKAELQAALRAVMAGWQAARARSNDAVPDLRFDAAAQAVARRRAARQRRKKEPVVVRGGCEVDEV